MEDIFAKTEIMDEVETSAPENMTGFLQGEIERLGLHIGISEPLLTDVDSLGAGSSGDVSVAIDGLLGRTVAVKSLHENLRNQPDQIERMIREAQAAAQLEHPNIVPVYTLGVSPKRGVYFTMKRLRGDSLRHIITQLAMKNPAYTWEYTLSRRLSIFIRICQGISYAHSKGILHRDLKPENVRIGSFGEVTIIDWGLVREVQPDEGGVQAAHYVSTGKRQEYHPGNTTAFENIIDTSNPTIDGELSGTPRYMSPEQADAQNSALDARSDIYSLGVILYELLTCYNPFFDKHTEEDIINAVIQGTFHKPRLLQTAKDVPVELEAICLKAMSRNKDKRYKTVAELLHDIYAHQEGKPVIAYKGNAFTNIRKLFQRNPLKSAVFTSIAISLLSFAGILYTLELRNFHTIVGQVESILQNTAARQETLQERLHNTVPIAGSALERLQNDINNNFNTANLLLSSISPLSQWRTKTLLLKERILIQSLRFDIVNRRYSEVERQLELIAQNYRYDLDQCSQELRDTVQFAKQVLKGDCIITSLDTSPQDAEITIFSLLENPNTGKTEIYHPIPIEEDFSSYDGPTMSSMEDITPRTTARTPVNNIKLPKGKYLLRINSGEAQQLNVPIFLEHGERCTLQFQLTNEIPEGTVYVPAGRAIVGGTHSHYEKERHAEEIPGFFIGKYEVTFAQYKEFYDSIKDKTLRDAVTPRLQFSGEAGFISPWQDDGSLVPMLSPEQSVVGVSHFAAEQFCQWYGKKIHRTCRLPFAYEWEKAARGTDGRLFPWGDSFHNDYALTFENKAGKERYNLMAPPGSFHEDVSPFNVMDMAGNVREWTNSKFDDGTDHWQIKGASFATSRRYLPLETADDTPLIPSDVGFRILIPFSNEDLPQYNNPSPQK